MIVFEYIKNEGIDLKCLVCDGVSQKQAVMLGSFILIQIGHYNYFLNNFFKNNCTTCFFLFVCCNFCVLYVHFCLLLWVLARVLFLKKQSIPLTMIYTCS